MPFRLMVCPPGCKPSEHLQGRSEGRDFFFKRRNGAVIWSRHMHPPESLDLT